MVAQGGSDNGGRKRRKKQRDRIPREFWPIINRTWEWHDLQLLELIELLIGILIWRVKARA